jgi:nucleolar GTP-binding protein
MQSVTALAHLRSCVLYFMDLSGECGYTVAQQVQLFHNIRPLFANKVTFLAINKVDRMKLSDLDPETAALVQTIFQDGTVEKLELSCATDFGVMEARNMACDRLLASRVEQKLKGGRINDVLNKIHLAQPTPRDDVPRLPFIPPEVQNRKLYDWNDPERRKLEKDLEVENGGAGAYSVDLKSMHPYRPALMLENYMLDDPDWKYDVLPEIMNGKNVYDLYDPHLTL